MLIKDAEALERFAGVDTLIATMPTQVIKAGGHVLLTHTGAGGFSLNAVPDGAGGTLGTGNVTFTADIADGGGIALFRDAGTVLDAVGFSGFPGGPVSSLYREGAGLASNGGTGITADGPWTFLRRRSQSGPLQDTNVNAADFVLVSTDAGTYATAPSMLGAPFPRAAASPIFRQTDFAVTRIDPGVSDAVTPNRVRVGGPAGPLAPKGTLEWRYRFQNMSGHTITHLRLRILDITTLGGPAVFAPAATADLRMVHAADIASLAISVPPGTVAVEGATVVQPPAQGSGGGLGSVLDGDLGAGRAAGDSVYLAVRAGVVTGGNFNLWVAWEALP